MRALLLPTPGNLDDLYIGEVAKPRPAAGEVLVRVRSMGLNPVDYQLATGKGVDSWNYPHILGEDVAGTIDEVGPGVTGFHVGDRVSCHVDLRKAGCFAEFVVCKAWTLAHVPDSVEDYTAAALPCAGLTAYQAIVRRLHVTKGQTIFITAGAGGVGGFAIQLARLAGARVLASTSGKNYEWVRNLGAEPIDYAQVDVTQTVLDLTDGRGVDGVLDSLGAQSATANLKLLDYAGGIVTIAGRPDISTVPAFTKAPSVYEVALGSVYQYGTRQDQALLAKDLATLLDLRAQGKLESLVTQVVNLEDIPDALRDLQGRHVRGKIVAQI